MKCEKCGQEINTLLVDVFRRDGGDDFCLPTLTTLLGQKIEIGKDYVFLKTIMTGSSTKRKVIMIGTCTKPNGRMQFLCKWAEGYSFPVGKKYNILNSKDVICEYIPINGYQIV